MGRGVVRRTCVTVHIPRETPYVFSLLLTISPISLYINIFKYQHKCLFPADVDISGLHCISMSIWRMYDACRFLFHFTEEFRNGLV